MALVKRFEEKKMERNSVHGEVKATYSLFPDERPRYLQIDTYGSPDRERPGKQSQTIQLGPEGIRELRKILEALPKS